MIIFSDLHLCEKTADLCFNEILPSLYTAVKEDKDKLLVCLGDFYHIRYKIDVAIQNKVFSYFENLSDEGVTVYLLPGNHDQINEQGENALTPLSVLSNVHVFDDICETPYGLFIPYRKNKNDITDYLSSMSEGTKPVFMHEDIIGFDMSNGILADKGVPYTTLAYLNRLVFSGHYHRRQNQGNVYYVGSPYQVDAGEAGQEKGYAKYNQDSRELDYVTTNWGPKYYNFGEVQKGTRIDNVRKGDVIRVKAPRGEDIETFRKSLLIPEGVNCVVEHTIEESASRLVVGGDSLEEYAKAYVEEFKGSLDADMLFDMYRQLNADK